MAQPFRIVAYSDYVCPWCYIGHRRIQQLQREFEVDVEWRPFELHPETPRTGASLEGRLGNASRIRAYTENILAIADESSITMKMPMIVSNSHKALEAAEFARERGRFDQMHEALFAAYFDRGTDVGDTDKLCEIARDAGIDDQGLRQALTDETYAARVDQVTAEARENEILSTPTFIFPGGFRLIGGQEYAVFASVTRRLMDRIASGVIEIG